ncbi:sensor histidine kinase [Urechidicola croceus]|nr:HAMP domain-containing sensor histidine kinase [Urechidicola croceus]
MNKRKLFIVIFIISVVGLAYIQYQYLRIGLNLAKVQFNEKISKTADDIKLTLSERNQLTVLLEKAITDDETYFKLSIDSVQDASKFFLNDYLSEQLVANGIKTDFAYQIFSKDSAYYFKSKKIISNDDIISYPIQLEGYLPEKLEKRLVLELQFEDLNNYFLFQLNGLTIPSILFMLAIITVIFWVLKSFYWQQNVITTTNEFINNLTHELKTPVFSIGLATKILEKGLDQGKKHILDIINQQNDRLKNHIDKVLELASLEQNRSVFDLKIIDFKPQLEKLCEEFKLFSKIEEVNFDYVLIGENYSIRAEIFHLENAINNLLDNAKKYTLKNPKIKLAAKIQGRYLVIIISDNGIGIDKKDVNRIFKKYYRVGNSTIHDVKGYGIGLNYVKTVIKKHKGSIDVESEVGVGTKMIIKIPIDKK